MFIYQLTIEPHISTEDLKCCPGCCGHSPLEALRPHPSALSTPLFSLMVLLTLQELRTWEEELTRAALQQKNQEELLRRREQELAEREIDILERELNIIIHQLCQEKPRVKKRKGKFRKSRLKLKDGNRISLPSGQWPGTFWEVEAGPGAGVEGICWGHRQSLET